MLGFTLAVGWAPCIGPILTAILALAAERDSLFQAPPDRGNRFRGTVDRAWGTDGAQRVLDDLRIFFVLESLYTLKG